MSDDHDKLGVTGRPAREHVPRAPFDQERALFGAPRLEAQRGDDASLSQEAARDERIPRGRVRTRDERQPRGRREARDRRGRRRARRRDALGEREAVAGEIGRRAAEEEERQRGGSDERERHQEARKREHPGRRRRRVGRRGDLAGRRRALRPCRAHLLRRSNDQLRGDAAARLVPERREESARQLVVHDLVVGHVLVRRWGARGLPRQQGLPPRGRGALCARGIAQRNEERIGAFGGAHDEGLWTVYDASAPDSMSVAIFLASFRSRLFWAYTASADMPVSAQMASIGSSSTTSL